MPLLTPEERIGTTVGGYRLDRLIGEGGMGVVFEATHAALETHVAIKLLHPHLTRDEGTATRFEREARAAAKIRHPNVVRILDFVKADDGAACIVMDLLTGESLTDRLKRAPLPPEEAAEVLLPIMDAIGFMHEAGIVHRDLKPDNIYLSREAGKIVPKLLDFGIAKVLDDSSHVTRTGMVVGTPAYMSPEQARGSKEIGPGVDIWAMGIVWFECIVGHTPFAADGPQAMLAEILTKRPPPMRSVAAHVSPHVADVIDTALAPKSERFVNMGAFAAALQAAFDAPAPSKPPPPKAQQPMPGSPLSSTGPIDPTFPPTRASAPATPQPMGASVATSDTLLADPDDPTRPSGNQLVPEAVAVSSGAVSSGPRRRNGVTVARKEVALVGLATGLLVGIGVVILVGAGSGEAEHTVTPTEAVNVAPPDAAADVAFDTLPFDALPADAPPDVVVDATELDAGRATMRQSTMMRRAEMQTEMQTEMEPEPPLPEQLADHVIDREVRFRANLIGRACGVHQRGRPNPIPAVRATFTIAADGTIARESIQFPREVPHVIRGCVSIHMLGWRFPRAQQPRTVTRSIPVMAN